MAGRVMAKSNGTPYADWRQAVMGYVVEIPEEDEEYLLRLYDDDCSPDEAAELLDEED